MAAGLLFCVALFLLGAGYELVRMIFRVKSRSLLIKGFWGERALYDWLQDRATARALGMDIDLVRARRKIDTATSPINVAPKK